MAEADFYMLEELRDWIKDKQYMGTVRTEYKTENKAADESEWKGSTFQRDDDDENVATGGHVEHVELFMRIAAS